MTISRWILLGMRNVLDKGWWEKQNAHFVFNKSCHLWDNVEKCGGARRATNDVTIWRISVAWCINKATCTHAHAHVHPPGIHPPPHTCACAVLHAHAHTHTHTQIRNAYCFSTAVVIRESASSVRYTWLPVLFVNRVTGSDTVTMQAWLSCYNSVIDFDYQGCQHRNRKKLSVFRRRCHTAGRIFSVWGIPRTTRENSSLQKHRDQL